MNPTDNGRKINVTVTLAFEAGSEYDEDKIAWARTKTQLSWEKPGIHIRVRPYFPDSPAIAGDDDWFLDEAERRLEDIVVDSTFCLLVLGNEPSVAPHCQRLAESAVRNGKDLVVLTAETLVEPVQVLLNDLYEDARTPTYVTFSSSGICEALRQVFTKKGISEERRCLSSGSKEVLQGTNRKRKPKWPVT